jgi:hypothetical protein
MISQSPSTNTIQSFSNQGQGQVHRRRTASNESNICLGEDGATLSALSQSTSKKVFTIRDVKSQFETEAEAEAAILKSIEENEKRARLLETDEAGIRRPSFLADIPADKVHLFMDVIDEVGVNEEGQVEAKSQTNPSNQKFKSVARRLMMIQKITSAHPTDETKNTDKTLIPEPKDKGVIGKANQIFRDKDIESQPIPIEFTKKNEEDRILTQKDEIKAVKANEHKRLHRKGCYGKYCGPCQTFTTFVSIRRQAAWNYTKVATLFIASKVAVAAILFYYFDNPIDNVGAAYSWYLLLVSKLTVTFLLAVLSEALLVDYLFLETKLAVMSIGRFLTLMTVQAKGWPLRIFFWAIWTFALIIGDVKLKQHWLNFQDKVELFTSANPGPPPDRAQNLDRFMIACIILGLSTMVKRAIFALYLGKKKYGM